MKSTEAKVGAFVVICAAILCATVYSVGNMQFRGAHVAYRTYLRYAGGLEPGTPVLFEIYERFDSVTASARRLLRALAPPILGAIALIVLVQAPLAWSLTRRLQRGYEERAALLANAIAQR